MRRLLHWFSSLTLSEMIALAKGLAGVMAFLIAVAVGFSVSSNRSVPAVSKSDALYSPFDANQQGQLTLQLTKADRLLITSFSEPVLDLIRGQAR